MPGLVSSYKQGGAWKQEAGIVVFAALIGMP